MSRFSSNVAVGSLLIPKYSAAMSPSPGSLGAVVPSNALIRSQRWRFAFWNPALTSSANRSKGSVSGYFALRSFSYAFGFTYCGYARSSAALAFVLRRISAKKLDDPLFFSRYVNSSP